MADALDSIAQRYAAARAEVGTAVRDALRGWDRAAAREPGVAVGGDVVVHGRDLRVLISHDPLETGIERHVSVSRTGRMGRADRRRSRPSLPSWEDLVRLRAVLWPDHVEVCQVLPGAGRGDRGVNLADVLHLVGPPR